MLYTRYAFARTFCRKKTVLEVGCATGQGLGYLAREARYVVGGDHAEIMVSRARRHYGRRMALLCLDAHTLPFRSASFDALILYEALYYLEDRSVAQVAEILDVTLGTVKRHLHNGRRALARRLRSEVDEP